MVRSNHVFDIQQICMDTVVSFCINYYNNKMEEKIYTTCAFACFNDCFV